MKSKIDTEISLENSFLLSLFLFFSMIVMVFTTPITVEAHKSYFLDVTYESNRNTLTYTIEKDESAVSGECSHTSAKRGLVAIPEKVTPSKENVDDEKGTKCSELKVKSLPFNFNPQMHSENFLMKQMFPSNNADSRDFKRAERVGNTLVHEYNEAVEFVYDGVPAKSMKEAMNRSVKMTGLLTGNSTIKGVTSKKGGTVKSDYSIGIDSSDYITITKNGESRQFQYRMIKGYNSKGVEKKFNFAHMQKDFKYESDVVYLTWNMILYQANYNYSVHGLTSSVNAESKEPGLLTRSIIGFLEDGLLDITSFLGLFSFQELIFNSGVRSQNYHHGVFPVRLKDLVDQFYIIFSAIAGTIMMFAFLKLLFTRAVSSMNPQMRVSLIDGIVLFLISMSLLFFFPILIDFAFKLNEAFVNIFLNAGVDLENLDGAANYSSIGGIIFAGFYLVMTIRFNFIYLMRGSIVALLLAAAPLFVSAIALGTKYKDMFGTYLKELLGNIFIQSIHAVVVTFVISATMMSRVIEVIVLLILLFALDNLFRSMIFGSSGGLVSQIGGKSTVATMSGLAAAGGFMSNQVANSLSKGKDNKGNSGPNKGSGGNGGNGGNGGGPNGGGPNGDSGFGGPSINSSYNNLSGIQNQMNQRDQIDDNELSGFKDPYQNSINSKGKANILQKTTGKLGDMGDSLKGKGQSIKGGLSEAVDKVSEYGKSQIDPRLRDGSAVVGKGLGKTATAAMVLSKGLGKVGTGAGMIDIDPNVAHQFSQRNSNHRTPHNESGSSFAGTENGMAANVVGQSNISNTDNSLNTEQQEIPINSQGVPSSAIMNGMGQTFKPTNKIVDEHGQYRLNTKDLSSIGVKSVHSNNSEIDVKYDSSKLNSTNNAYLSELNKQWSSGGAAKEHLQNQGINSVTQDKQNPNLYQIKYNKMTSNIKDVSLSGSEILITPKNKNEGIQAFNPVNLYTGGDETPKEEINEKNK